MSDRNTCRLPSCENEPRGREPDVDERDRRALTEYLTVLEDLGRARDADGLYLVVSQSGSEYLVDAHTGACECPDHEYRGVHCKHARRMAFATGDRPSVPRRRPEVSCCLTVCNTAPTFYVPGA